MHYKLRSLKKGEESMQTYITRIKEVCDALTACNSSVSNLEHIATILNGLPLEYQSFVAVITASLELYTLEAAISVLFDAEMSLFKLFSSDRSGAEKSWVCATFCTTLC